MSERNNSLLYVAAFSFVAIAVNTVLYARKLTHAQLIAKQLDRIGEEQRDEDSEWLRRARIHLDRWRELSPMVRTYIDPPEPDWTARPSVRSPLERRV